MSMRKNACMYSESPSVFSIHLETLLPMRPQDKPIGSSGLCWKGKFGVSYRIRIENVLLNSNVLSEVQRSLVDGGMHIEDLLIDQASHAGAMSSHLVQPRPVTDSPVRNLDGFVGVGGPAGLWHFIYKSNYLDQYVSSEFSSPINSLRQQKR